MNAPWPLKAYCDLSIAPLASVLPHRRSLCAFRGRRGRHLPRGSWSRSPDPPPRSLRYQGVDKISLSLPLAFLACAKWTRLISSRQNSLPASLCCVPSLLWLTNTYTCRHVHVIVWGSNILKVHSPSTARVSFQGLVWLGKQSTEQRMSRPTKNKKKKKPEGQDGVNHEFRIRESILFSFLERKRRKKTIHYYFKKNIEGKISHLPLFLSSQNII